MPEFREILDFTKKQQLNNQNTQVEMDLERVRNAHTPEEVERAIEWVLTAFEGMIREDPGTGYPMIYFAKFTNDAKAKKKGWCMKADGRFVYTRAISAERLALYYIDVILDESIQSDEDRIWAMIDNSKKRIPPKPLDPEVVRSRSQYPLHPELLFLIGEDKAGEPKLELWIHGDKADEV